MKKTRSTGSGFRLFVGTETWYARTTNKGMKTSEEIEALKSGGKGDSEHAGLLKTDIFVSCPGTAVEVLTRTKDALLRVIENWPIVKDSVSRWEQILPEWFVDSCWPELPEIEIQALLRSEEGVQRLSKMWTLSEFTYQFDPNQRNWYWWDSTVIDSNTLRIGVGVSGFPFAWGELEFLLTSAGAERAEVV